MSNKAVRWQWSITPRYPNKTHAYLPKINRYAKISYNWIKLSTTEIDINDLKTK